MKSQRQLKPAGTWEVLRRIRIARTTPPDALLATGDAIRELPGVKNIAIESDRRELRILYDASQVNYSEIIQLLTDADLPPVDHWWARLKARIYQFSDSNARDNAKAPPPACCNKSPR